LVTDAELRGRVLQIAYDLRSNNEGWVPISDINFSGAPVTDGMIAIIGQNLANADLIEWKPEGGGVVVGQARITGHGVDVIRKKATPRIEIVLPGETPAPAVPPKTSNAVIEGSFVPDSQGWDVAAQIAVDAQRRRVAAVAQSATATATPLGPTAQPPITFVAAGSMEANATIIPATVPITLTHYPENPGGTVVVHNHIVINIQTANFKQFTTQLDELIAELHRSNEFSVEVREKLLAEIKAGKEIISAPKPDKNYIELLLTKPLKYLADKAGSAIISKLAGGLLDLLGKITGLW
jgi:hypothetical protein